MVKFFCIGLMSAVALLPLQTVHARVSAAQVTLAEGGEAVVYRGMLETPAIIQVEDLIRDTNGRVKRLVIDSGGGEINLGMDLAELVIENGLDVVVEKLCASSCANYVFPAGKTKRITPGALVLWHGSVIQDEIELPEFEDFVAPDGVELSPLEKQQLMETAHESYAQYIADSQARQEVFFKRLGVDARVTVMGQQVGASEEWWTLSPQDMAYFGIHNVTAASDYAQVIPADIKARGAKLLRLADYPYYTN